MELQMELQTELQMEQQMATRSVRTSDPVLSAPS